MSLPILSAEVRFEQDVVGVRQRARQVAGLLGFDSLEQTRIATAVSEVARNAFRYAGGGMVRFLIEGKTAPQLLIIQVSDQGPGIAELDRILAGSYRSPTGMGMGLLGARRLTDGFQVETGPKGTTVHLKKLLPARSHPVGPEEAARIAEGLVRESLRDPLHELREQNSELLRALEELRRRQEELERLNRELEDTNRGVVALYAELDERADHLRRADEVKTRFLSNMSHEFRTPLHAIEGLCRILLDRQDGDLTAEQTKQVGFIHKAAEDLSSLVNDLLDLAKVEAGKIEVHPGEFQVASLFGALRGMLRPLLLNESVSLVFEEPTDLPPLHTDEGKVSQVLRNFISNALKFTERGEVRVSATASPDGGTVVFSVADTGIGIAPEDQERIFQEFTQVQNPLQRKVKGTGLGLPLCRRLASLLGGTVCLDSRPGQGSTFHAVIPRLYSVPAISFEEEDHLEADPTRIPVLLVEDSEEALHIYGKHLAGTEFQPIAARSVPEARRAMQKVKPAAVVLDILLRGEDSWKFLVELKEKEETRPIPVLVISTVDDQGKGISLGAETYLVKPVERASLLLELRRATRRSCETVLLIDDEEVSRYLLRQALLAPHRRFLEAANGQEGLRLALLERPRAIFLDLAMPGMSGEEVLERLRADPATRDVPVIIYTGRELEERERRRLEGKAVAVLSKAQGPPERKGAAFQEVLARAGM